MRIDITIDEPFENIIFWQVDGTLGIVDFMPPMNDSISRAMIEPDTRYDAIVNIGWAVPLPNRSFRYITQSLVGAPHNFKMIVCVVQNPLTKAVLSITLGNEVALKGRFFMVGTLDEATAIIRKDKEL